MSNLPAKHRGPGRPKGSASVRPKIIKMLEKHRVIERLIEDLDGKREVLGDDRYIQLLAKLADLGIASSPKDRPEGVGGTQIFLRLDGVDIKPLRPVLCAKCQGPLRPAVGVPPPPLRSEVGVTRGLLSKAEGKAPALSPEASEDSRNRAGSFRNSPSINRRSLPPPEPPPDPRTPREIGEAAQREAIRVHILKSEKKLIALNEVRDRQGLERLGTLPEGEIVPREFTNI